jgi:hypothetical protein
VDVLLANGGPASAALMVGEQAKSRTLSDIVRGLVARSQPDMSSEVDSLDEDRRAIYGELFSGAVPSGSDRSDVLRRRLHELETRRRLIDLDAGSPSPHPNDPTVVADASVSDGTVTISFVRSGDLLNVFVVDGTTVRGTPRPVSGVLLAELVDRLRRQWDKFRLGDDLLQRHLPQLHRATNALLREMYDLIIAPIEPLIRSIETNHLIFVPDGVAHDVPFAALFDGASHLIEDYTLSVAPSILTLSHLPARHAGPALVVGVADTLAPLVEEEARAVAELLPSSQLLCGTEATWAALRPAVTGIQHLHLAGHTVFRPDNPMFSAIKLADTWVTAADLLTTNLDGATVVLSSCDSARTQSRGSAEINGFVRSFLGAGAATVLASQWSADDSATRALMEAFYRHLASENPASALRSAQLGVAERWPHPYYWAPWVLTGRHAS